MLNAFKLPTGMLNKITPNKKVILLVGCIVVFSSFAIHLASPKIFSAAAESNSPAIGVTADSSYNSFENILADGLVPNGDVILNEGAITNMASDCSPDYGLVLGSTNFYASESNAGFSSTSSTTTTNNNGVGAPNGTGISVFNTGDRYQGLFVFPNTFSRGAKITITAKYNDQRSDGVTLEFGSGGTNAATATYTAPSPTINGFSQNSYVNVDYTVPTSLTGTYNYIRVRGVSGQTYLNIDAINVTPAVCNTCPAGSSPPALSSTTVFNVCPTQTFNLTSITASNQPANTTLTWHTATPTTTANRVSNTTAAPAGVYYAAFYSSANDCYNINFNASPAVVKTEGDFDCDGVTDTADVDDDNDGILDAIESPECFYTQNEATRILSISTGGVNGKLHNNNYDDELEKLKISNKAGFNFINNSSISGIPAFTFEIQSPIDLGSLVVTMRNGNSFLDAAGSGAVTRIILQASNNGSTWIDLSDPVEYDRIADNDNNNRTETFTATKNAGRYKYFRIIGDPTSTPTVYGSSTALVDGITFNPKGTYQASKNPKPTCTADADGDGIPNHRDLDSDNDGCSDAYEASTTLNKTANFSFGTSQPDANNNGLNDNLETPAAPGVFNGTYTYRYANTNAIVACTDTDNDGVGDLVDIDDDNDGVFDATESPSCFYDVNEARGIVNITTEMPYPAGKEADFQNLKTSLRSQFTFTDKTKIAGRAIFTLELADAVVLDTLQVEIDGSYNFVNSNQEPDGGTESYTYTILQGSNNNTSWTDLTASTYQNGFSTIGRASIFREVLFPVTRNKAAYKYYRIIGDPNVPTSDMSSQGIVNGFIFLINEADYNQSEHPKPTCNDDIDGDGTPNHRDLDSDGDNCSDAYETGVTTDKTPNFTFGANQPDANKNGFNDTLEKVNPEGDDVKYIGDYTTQYSKNGTLILCSDIDGDGIPDLEDLDADNDGILNSVEMAFPQTTDATLAPGSTYTYTMTRYYNYDNGNNFGGQMAGFPPEHVKDTFQLGTFTGPADSPFSINIPQFAPSDQYWQRPGGGGTERGVIEFVHTIKPGEQGTYVFSNVDVGDHLAVIRRNRNENEFKDDVIYSKYRGYQTGSSQGFLAEAYYEIGDQLIVRWGEEHGNGIWFRGFEVTKKLDGNLNIPGSFVGYEALDTDGDGIPNYLDLDSDNDRCSDAFEAGVTSDKTPDFVFVNAPDLNKNGFNDDLETVQAGKYDDKYTYQFAINNAKNLCQDADGDGVVDLVDIDDDNDGILDAVESPTCFYTQTEAHVITKVSTGLANDDGVNVDLPFMRDGVTTNVTASNNVITANQAINGAVIYTIEYPTSIRLTSISHFGTSFGTSATAKIMASNDGINWVDMMTAATAATANPKTFTINQNTTTEYRYYRIVKVAGTTTPTITSYEVNAVTNTSTYGASAHPKPTCTGSDLDGDGIPNHLDLDSDGDGCTDAFEAGVVAYIDSLPASENATVSNGNVVNKDSSGGANKITNTIEAIAGSGEPADYGQNGLYNKIENTDNPNATYKNTNGYTYGNATSDTVANCVDCSLSENKTHPKCDFDGDGIPNKDDIDDDNDGVLDVIEDCSPQSGELFNFPNQQNESTPYNGTTLIDQTHPTVIAGVDVKVTVNNAANIRQIQSVIASQVTTDANSSYNNYIILRSRHQGNPGVPSAINPIEVYLDFSKPITNFSLVGSHITDAQVPARDEHFRVMGYYKNLPVTPKSVTPTNTNIDENGYYEANGPLVNSGPDFGQVNYQFDSAIDRITVFYHINGGSNTEVNGVRIAALSGCVVVDTDNDGIPNKFDLDSDGDGCPDAKEAGVIDYIEANNFVKSSGDVQNKPEDGGNRSNVAEAIAGSGNTSDYGENGFYNELEDVDDQNAIYQNTAGYTYFNATNKANNISCIDCSLTQNKTSPYCDFDGDGVLNKDDIDDDNDGVLDVDECYDFIEFGPADLGITASSNNFSGSESGIVDVSSSFNLPPNSVIISYSGASYFDNSGTGDYKFTVADGKPITFEFTGSVPVRVKARHGGFLQGNTQDGIESQSEIYKFNLSSTIRPEFSSGSNATQKFVQNNTSNNFSNTGGDFTWESTEVVSQIKFYTTNPAAADGSFNNRINLEIAPTCGDTDGDGIPNNFDLDSDGDGCTDAKEAGVIAYIDANSYVKSSGDVQNKPADGGNKTGVAEAIAGSGAASDYGTNGFYNELEDVDNQDAVYENTAGYTYTKATDKSDTSSCCEFTDENFIVSTTTPTTCSPANDGTITISGAGTLPSTAYTVTYNYKSTPTATPTAESSDITSTTDAEIVINNLSPGQYSDIVVTSKSDATCTKSVSNAIQVNAFENTLGLTLNLQDETRVNANDGILDVAVTNGSGNYSYQWFSVSDDGTETAVTGGNMKRVDGTQSGVSVPPGKYKVVVTDTGTGCTASAQGTVSEYDCNTAIQIGDPEITQPLCNGGNTGKVKISFTGNATANYTYEIFVGDSQTAKQTATDIDVKTYEFTNLTQGTYTIRITDSKGCSAEHSFAISEPTAINLSAQKIQDQQTVGGSEGIVGISSVSGGTPMSNGTAETKDDYTYVWTDQSGNVVASNSLGRAEGLAPGNYTVTATDANGCSSPSRTVTVGAVNCSLTGSFSAAKIVCNDGSGTKYTEETEVTVTASGGQANYTYVWKRSGESTALRTETTSSTTDKLTLPAGSYTVEITDMQDCVTTVNVTVEQSAEFTASGGVTKVSCFGGDNGGIDLTVQGGTGSYTYQWIRLNGDNTQDNSFSPRSTEDVTNLIAGTYKVTITDAQSCSIERTIVVTQPSAAISFTGTVEDVACNGAATGKITLSDVSGGTGTYTYSWSGPSITAATMTAKDQTNLAAGNYSVIVRDSNDCGKTQVFSVSEPTTALAIEIDETDATQSNADSCNNGQATARVSGGTGAYTYQWYEGSTTTGTVLGTTATISDLSGGKTYTVLVTDVKGCTIVQSVNIECTNDCDTAVSIDSEVDVACKGDTTGSATVSASSALNSGASFNFVWTNSNGDTISTTNAATSSTISGVPAGSYTVSVTRVGASGCAASKETVVISEPANALTVTTSGSGESFTGSNDGTATATANGGTVAYSYSWSGPSITAATRTAKDQTGLAPGNYTVTVTDANGCSATANFVVSAGDCNNLSASATLSNVSCNGGADGSITVSPQGGTGTYTYQWYAGETASGTQISTAQSVSGLAAGKYSVRVSSTGSSCSVDVLGVQVGQPQPLNLGGSVTDVVCKGGNTGAVDLTPSGGTGTYTFSWTGTDSFASTSEDISALKPGTYTVTMTDANNCTVTANYTVSEPANALSAALNLQDETRVNGNDGILDVAVTNGSGNYSYQWFSVSDDGTETAVTGGDMKRVDGTQSGVSVPPGKYKVVVTDTGTGCTASAQGTVSEYDCNTAIQIGDPEITQPLCNGGNTGKVKISFTGNATANYTYEIFVGDSQTAKQTATDIDVKTYEFTNLTQGTYTIRITDSKGCSAEHSFAISEPTAINLSAQKIQDQQTVGGSEGIVGISSVSGGTPMSNGTAETKDDYTYVWTDQSGNVVASNSLGRAEGLAPGNYTVTATDANGCSSPSRTVTVGAVNCSLTGSFSAAKIVCNDGSGTKYTEETEVTVTASGGQANYTYVWKRSGESTALRTETTSSTTDKLTLPAGSYTVEITDMQDCVTTVNVTVEQSAEFTASGGVTKVSCFGGDNGGIDLTVQGGTGSYTYQWIRLNGDNTQDNSFSPRSTEDVTNLIAGTYKVTITDAQSCSIERTIVVTQPSAAISFTGTVEDVACNGAATGKITLSDVSGGTGTYTYSWSGPSITAATMTAKDQTNLAAGNYSVIVRDSNDCGKTQVFSVSEPTTALAIEIDETDATQSNADSCNNGQATARVSGGTGAYTYQWYEGSTTTGTVLGTTATISDLSGGKTYTVLVTDVKGCTIVQSVNIECTNDCDTAVSIDSDVDVACKGDASGSATVSASSALNSGASFNFVWTNSNGDTISTTNAATSSTISGVPAGSYTVSVTRVGASGCAASKETVVISEPANALTVTTSGSGESFTGSNDGTATATANGGTVAYSYSWSGPSITAATRTSKDQTGLAPGNYTVTVTDANGCSATANFVVSAGDCNNLSASATLSNVSCNGGADGSITVSPQGGTGTYTYQWYAGETASGTQISTDQSVSGLSAGKYSVRVSSTGSSCSVDVLGVQVGQPQALSLGGSVTDVACNGGNTAAIDLTPSGGTGAYMFSWTGPESFTSTSEDISGLAAGTYTVTMTDANGCTVTASFEIKDNCTNAVQDIANTFKNTPVSGNVLTNDTDPEGDTLRATPQTDLATASGGVVTINADGSYTYTPAKDYVGEDSFSYTMCDDGTPVACDSATVFIEVLDPANPANEPPVANGDVATAKKDTALDINVLINDFDPDRDPITITEVGQPSNGKATINDGNTPDDPSDDTIIYTPNSGFTGTDTFTYQICDNATPKGCDTATVEVTVEDTTARNTTTANDDAYTTYPGDVLRANVLDNDNDLEDDMQSASLGRGPRHGNLELQPDGSFEYTPDAGYQGPDSFTYTVCDDGMPQACDTATVVITVGGIKNSTNAVQDITNTFKNTPVSGNVLTNDTDPEGDTLRATPQTDLATASGGVVTINADGSYTYTPAKDYVGEDSFSYTMCDDGTPVACDSATVFIEVLDPANPANEPPVANGDVATAKKDTALDINVLINDFDPDRDPITITEVGQPSNGKATINDGNTPDDPSDDTIIYTPNSGFTGTDTFTYQICDNATPKGCDTATVEVTVEDTTARNTTTANDDAYTTYPGDVLRANVLDNDNDLEDDIQSASLGRGPRHGNLELQPDGSFEYTPDAGYQGPDSFTYTVCDDGMPQACDTATVVITVGGIKNSTNAVQDITNTFKNTPVSGNVLTNDTDPEGDTLRATPQTDLATASGGVVTINADGSYTYTPATDYVGEDSFSYTMCDDGTPQACDSATVFIEVLDPANPANEPPVANGDVATAKKDTALDINVLINDFDPDRDPITITEVGQPSNGKATINDGNTPDDPSDDTIIYTPNPGFTGTDTFTYQICDNATPKGCDTATVEVTVEDTTARNTTTANDDAYTTYPGDVLRANVLDNDNDLEDDIQSASLGRGPRHGNLELQPDGSFEYTPDAGYQGPDSFTYTVCDDGMPQACDTATVVITVGGIKNSTNAVQDITNTFKNTPVSGNVLTNDTDPEGDTLRATPQTDLATASGGVVTINADGSYTYTPATDYVGEDSFSYTMCDDGTPVACDSATVFIEVLDPANPANEPPVANGDVATAKKDTALDINVLINDFDPDRDPITITEVGQPSNGKATINDGNTPDDPSDDTIIYTPNPGFTGTDTFTYQICDNATPKGCDTATVEVTVEDTTARNTTTANDDAYTTYPGDVLRANVLDNDNDLEDDMQSASLGRGPSHGSLELQSDGSFEYTPDAGYQGPDSFTYTVCDDGMPQACDTATVVITVGGIKNSTNAKNDINNTYVNQSVSGNVLTNDSDLEGDVQTISATGVFSTPNGSVTLNADGSYVYTPKADFIGADSFTYQVCDDGTPVACDTATVYIEVIKALITPDTNTPPVANADTAETTLDVPVSGNLLANDFDQDGDKITVTQSSITTSNGGTVTIDPITGNYTYTPAKGFKGTDTFTYEICDDASPKGCDTAVVTITVLDLPSTINTTTANDDAYNSNSGLAITGNVLDNDFDAQGDTQTVTLIGQPLNGRVVLLPNGEFTYTPNDAMFSGVDKFEYEVCDNGIPKACDRATVIITYDGGQPRLVFTKLSNVTNDGSVGDTIEYSFSVENVGNSTAFNVLIDDDRIGVKGLVVTPKDILPGQRATASATYTITAEDVSVGRVENSAIAKGTDQRGNPVQDVSDNGNETKDSDGDGDPGNDPTITFTNDKPIAVNDDRRIDVNDALSTISTPIDILGNDDFRADGPVGGSLTIISNPRLGTLDINDNGTPDDPSDDIITYTPITDLEVTDVDTFEYQICDSNGDCSIATVTITIIGVGPVDRCKNPDISNVLTPNDDGKNDWFKIDNIDCYPSNTMQIFNRWGVRVFEATNYGFNNNVFRGYSNGRVTIKDSERLPVGTYFYIFKYVDPEGIPQQASSYVYLQY